MSRSGDPSKASILAGKIVVGATAVIIGALIVLAMVKEFFPGNPWIIAECNRMEKASAAAPDESWLARHFFFACGGPLTSQVWSVIVIVKQGEEPGQGDEVWKGDFNGKLTLEWKGADRLHVTLPNETLTYKQNTSHLGIAVEYSFDPDDPAARQEFVAKQTNR
jgi:hypothetical protein